ncbi:MAG TPA: sigma-70 family RNA polymerase sigma factor [Trebonia sp.]|nr:sigma-70 family RNA polymerase sigma factor [Trebonia sp.]
MRDRELVASIVAGDPEGLAAAYDRYSGPLFGYCQSLLREPDDAADAVQDTFVIAASKVGRLRDPERLRAWLFTVARNECLHRLKARRAAAVLEDLPDQADESVDVGGEAERAESRELIRAAVGGLNDGERDVINQLWHGLEIPEVATVLGVSRNHAHSLFSRARDQLEASVGVLVVGRSGRKDCAALDQLLHGWDGRLTAPLRRRVGRHIDRCSVCSDRRRRELRPATLLSVAPGALAGVALAGGGPASLVLAPAGLRATVLQLAVDHGAAAVAYRAAAGQGTRSFQLNGFPQPVHVGHLGLVRIAHLPLSAVGGTAAATATAVVLAVVPHAHSPRAAVGSPVTATASGATPSASASGPMPGSTLPGRLSAVGANAGRALPVTRATSLIGAVTATGPGTGAATSAPPESGSTASGTPTAGATTPTGTPAPIVSVTVSTPVLAGSLSVSPSAVSLSALVGGTLTLTANGGPVTWSISRPPSLLGLLTVSPSSGTLAAGQSVTVHLRVSLLSALTTTLTVAPGDQIVNLLIGAL